MSSSGIEFTAIFASTGSPLVKNTVALHLRQEIIAGRLCPGDPVVEGKWAARLNVAQSSVRAALHILETEGFVERNGRSARVTKITNEGVRHNFQVRAALEELVARLVAENRPDLSELDQVVADMKSAVQCNNLQAFYERDLKFHLLLCRKSGNPVLEQMLERLLVPLFAFVVMRTHDTMGGSDRWLGSIAQHERILDALRSGDPARAVACVSETVGHFYTDIDELTRVREQRVISSNQR